MKKFFLASILMGSLFFATACGSASEAADSVLEASESEEGEAATEETAEETVTEKIATEETATEEVTTENNVMDEAATEDFAASERSYELDGYYASSMSGTETGVLSMQVTGDELHIEGTFAYDASDAGTATSKYYEEERAEAEEYVFLLSEDTQFIAVGGDADSLYDRQTFEDSYCTQPDLGLGLTITVENGVVTTIETAS